MCVDVEVIGDQHADQVQECSSEVGQESVVLLADGPSEDFFVAQHVGIVDVKGSLVELAKSKDEIHVLWLALSGAIAVWIRTIDEAAETERMISKEVASMPERVRLSPLQEVSERFPDPLSRLVGHRWNDFHILEVSWSSLASSGSLCQ